LFISYPRIAQIDFDATSSDLVALSLLCRAIQSESCVAERKSRKIDMKEKRDLMTGSVELRVTYGGLSKVEVSVFPLKSPKPRKNIVIVLQLSLFYQAIVNCCFRLRNFKISQITKNIVPLPQLSLFYRETVNYQIRLDHCVAHPGPPSFAQYVVNWQS
jgi:hypothetical protein